MELITFTLDDRLVTVPKGTTVLEAARQQGIEIPTLCHLQGLNHSSSCRVCLVESGPRLIASCTLAAEEGMRIRTNTDRVRKARKTTLELILSDHDRECTSCARNGACELSDAANRMNIREHRYGGEVSKRLVDATPSIVRDTAKCILCGRCVAACAKQGVHAIGFSGRGFTTMIGPAYGRSLADSTCVNCGQCILACPVGALQERNHTDNVWAALADPNRYVVVQTAPAVRIALGEAFGYPIGTRVTGKMVAALRRLGFDQVFDTDFAADLTIMEEGTELLERLSGGNRLPLMTSCCPGWVKFMEHEGSDLLEHLSSCKSPHEMEGAMIKSYFAERSGVDPDRIVVVSIMPCTAKKFESNREELSVEGRQDVDYVLTTRELAAMIKEAGIEFARLPDEAFDSPFGEGTGAGVIFGATGGVAEAAIRTVAELTGGRQETVDFLPVRGMAGLKEAEVVLADGRKVRTAVVHGLDNARRLLDQMREGERRYDFIEVMACPGGCLNGGGQPFVDKRIRESMDIRAERAKAIYAEDASLPVRKSHLNPQIHQIYEEFLGEPGGAVSHRYLHTHYKPRPRF